MSNRYENLAGSLARATSVCSVGSYALGFGTMFLAIVMDAWGLFIGVALLTAVLTPLAVVTGIVSLLMHRLSKAGGEAWKKTLRFTLLAAAYMPLMAAVWMGLGFHH